MKECIMCKFYVPRTKAKGHCHINPPALGGWPQVCPSDWCGSYRKKDDGTK